MKLFGTVILKFISSCFQKKARAFFHNFFIKRTLGDHQYLFIITVTQSVVNQPIGTRQVSNFVRYSRV